MTRAADKSIACHAQHAAVPLVFVCCYTFAPFQPCNSCNTTLAREYYRRIESPITREDSPPARVPAVSSSEGQHRALLATPFFSARTLA